MRRKLNVRKANGKRGVGTRSGTATSYGGVILRNNTLRRLIMKTSESIGEISKALAKAQGTMQPAKFDAKNPFFKSEYATLTSIMAACRPALSENGIAIVQGASVNEKMLTVTTMLTHSSGEFISDDLTMAIIKTGPQDIGSAITYARRYSLSSMVGIVSDADDDGESSKTQNKPAQRTQNKQSNKTPVPAKKVPPAKPEPPKKAKATTPEEPEARTGVQVANQMKKARQLLVDVGCKSRNDMMAKTQEIIGRELQAGETLANLSRNEMDTLITKLGDIKLAMEVGK